MRSTEEIVVLTDITWLQINLPYSYNHALQHWLFRSIYHVGQLVYTCLSETVIILSEMKGTEHRSCHGTEWSENIFRHSRPECWPECLFLKFFLFILVRIQFDKHARFRCQPCSIRDLRLSYVYLQSLDEKITINYNIMNQQSYLYPQMTSAMHTVPRVSLYTFYYLPSLTNVLSIYCLQCSLFCITQMV